jgi:hypothetical protein
MNAVAEVNHNTAVAVPGFDPFAAYGQQAASGAGNFLKFSKHGEWLLGKDDKELPCGTRLVANMDDMTIGWLRWESKVPVERLMGLLVQGYKPQMRNELGHDDQAAWETDKEGRPQDPWKFTNEIPMADPETGEQISFGVSSKGGIGAVGNLCKEYGKQYRQRLGQVPVIELQRTSYTHTEYGKTYVPVLSIVDWRDAMPDAPAVEEEVETKAAPEKAAKSGATRF